MAKQNLATSPTHFSRPGEGTLVELHVLPSKGVSGGSSAVMRASFANVPVPSKRYSSDMGAVSYSRETFKILFGQEKLNSESELRTLLIVKMTPGAVARFLKSVEEADPKFEALAKQAGLEPESMNTFAGEPKETVAFDANFVLAAFSGREACLDFYHSSAFSVSSSIHTKKLALDPVVRVDLRSTLLLGLIKTLRQTLSTLPERVLEGQDE